jgi:transcription factor IIIB subunit 2
LAIALRGLNDSFVDQAVQWYKLALTHNFTQGRKQGHVIAACLYIVCRQNKTMRTFISNDDL